MRARVQAYESDPYLREVETRVTAAGDDRGRPFVVLDETVFYPEGGGQPCDHGVIEGVPVVDVQRVDREIRHYLNEPLAETSVRAVLDWPRRYDHMQQHTAQHLLSALFLDRHDWPTNSFHLGEDRCDIELGVDSIEPDVLAEVESEFMEKVRAALSVTARCISVEEYRALELRGRGLPSGHEGSVRLVDIEGVDTTTCGGTHLSSTAEIESVHLGPVERMRGGSRLYWIAGGRVRRRIHDLERRVAEMRTLFETSEEELAAAAEARLAALKASSQEVRHLAGKLAEAHVHLLASSTESLVEVHFDGADGGFLANVGRLLAARADAKVGLLTASTADSHFFLVLVGDQSGVSLAEVAPVVAELLDGRGGGSGSTYQGKAGSLEHRREAVEALRSSLED